ncbi:unnamed protein product [Rotaria sordida]|uniref:Uncharacterized protein n=1 Tax=Rotaria sordida TaxID=392033 RepID=A0A814VPY4_9BILA|nr:unnamed protein product [Rotaria sordida]
MLNIENSIDSTWIPRLKVPLAHSFSIPQGEFIIIDTPGPNDSNLSAHLRQIVISELQKATLILVALEFIGSDSNDEAKLQEDIETIREYKDTDSPSYLYALVNKIDQRIEGKHNSIEQTKAAVAMKYKIPVANVHEISAMNAILSYTFRQEYEELEKKSDVTHETLMSKTKSYKMFMQQALGQTWEQAAEYIHVNLLPNIAEKLWKKSNYDSFLHNTLGIVSQHVMPICLTMALQKCNYYIQKCYEKISIRKSCLDIGEESLLETIDRLKKDQQQLDWSRKEAEKPVHQWHCNVVEYVTRLFDEAGRTYQVKINQLSKKQLEHAAIDALKENLKKLEQHAVDEATERICTVFSSHFNSIESYLLEQSNNIRTAIDDKKMERKAIEKQFDLILNELNGNKEKVQNMLKTINTHFKD